MDCLSTIVGISKTGCDCLNVDASESLSGLYLDDSNFGRIPLSAAVYDCSDEELIEYLNRLIPDAITEANRMLYMEFESQLIPRYQDYNFKLPRKEKYSRQLQATSGYYYMNIRPKYFRGSIMKISSIRIPNTTGTVKIIDEYGTEYYSGTQAAFTVVNLVMDRDYFIAYQSATRPYNYEFNCGCGGEDTGWKKYVYLGGATADTLNDLTFVEGNNSYGVIIEGHFSCDPFAPLCDLDYTNNNWGRVYANLVQLIAKRNFAGWIVSSGQITNYLTTQGEELPELIGYFNKEINDRLKFLPKAYNLTDCYQCGSSFKGAIIC